MSSVKVKTQTLEVGKVRVGTVIQFTATARVISLTPANDDEPTLSDNVYVLALVGDSGLYNGRKVKVKVRHGEKVEALYNKPWALRLWDYFHCLLWDMRKPKTRE